MEFATISSSKKWVMGVHKSKSPIEIGFITDPKDAMHYHTKVYEYYVVIFGELTLIVDDKEVVLKAGNICCIEPGEKHMIIRASKDFKCYILKYPHLSEDKVPC